MNNTIIEHKSGTAVILKSEGATGVRYFICTLESGLWCSMNVNPYHEENDTLAMEMLDLYMRQGSLSGIETLCQSDQAMIRDRMLNRVYDDNFVLFTYNEHCIFHAWNDTSETGCYFVSTLDGDELISYDSVQACRTYIDIEVANYRYFEVIGNDSPDRFVIRMSGIVCQNGERLDNNAEILSEAVSQDILEYEIANNCAFYVNEIDKETYEAKK